MKHVKYAEKSVLVGDDAADTLMEYARVIGDNGGADTVTLEVISPDGNVVEATFLLNGSTEMMIESTNADINPPDNAAAVREMQERIDAIARPSQLQPETRPDEEWQDASGLT
jgi:hypothetical protein